LGVAAEAPGGSGRECAVGADVLPLPPRHMA